ncbi:MAG: virulence protein SciE type [Methylococcaceae bacterium]|nr:virulence protein SciE type [Methylococcaceae bacterium]
MSEIQQLINTGNLASALKAVQQQVRSNPADAKNRVLLFQIQVILGEWDKARTQLDVLKDLDSMAQFMVQTYQQVLLCEGIRKDVFSGKRAPMIFGEPEPWIASMLEALRMELDGQIEAAQLMRADALKKVTVVSGEINNEAFEWIADADSRIGPMLEAVVNGQYYWIPFHRLSVIQITAPEDLRDFVWLPAQFVWANGGEAFGFIPSRYSGSENSADNLIQLARKTEWQEISAECYKGLGQRMLATDKNDYALLDIREIKFNPVTTD